MPAKVDIEILERDTPEMAALERSQRRQVWSWATDELDPAQIRIAIHVGQYARVAFKRSMES